MVWHRYPFQPLQFEIDAWAEKAIACIGMKKTIYCSINIFINRQIGLCSQSFLNELVLVHQYSKAFLQSQMFVGFDDILGLLFICFTEVLPFLCQKLELILMIMLRHVLLAL